MSAAVVDPVGRKAHILILPVFDNKRPPYWPFIHWDVSLRVCTKFYPNRATAGRVMMSRAFFKMVAMAPQINFRFRVRWHNSLVWIKSYMRTKFGRNLSIYSWGKTTSGRHIGLLLPVSILTIYSSSECHSVSAYQTSSQLDVRWPSYDVMCIFQDVGRPPF